MTNSISNRIARMGAAGLVLATVGLGLFTASASADNGGKSCLWTNGEWTASVANGVVMNGNLADADGTLLWTNGTTQGTEFKCIDGKWTKVPAKPVSKVSPVSPKFPTNIGAAPTFELEVPQTLRH